jgi:hypothetical protein
MGRKQEIGTICFCERYLENGLSVGHEYYAVCETVIHTRNLDYGVTPIGTEVAQAAYLQVVRL